MKFEFTDLDQVPLVQAKKKYATFTVREIGGPEEIEVWRRQQRAKEEASLMARQLKLEATKARMAQDLPEGDPNAIAWKGQATGRSWQEKQAHAASERKRLAQLEDGAIESYTPSEPEKLTVWMRIKRFIKTFWENAKF